MVNEDYSWNLKPHTKAKHAILKTYLDAWFPIISKNETKIAYIDGFAGRGKYDDGEDGSPIIAIKAARDHVLSKYFKDLKFFFVELDEQNYESLCKNVKDLGELPKFISTPMIEKGDFNKVIEQMLGEIDEDKHSLIPTFAFIDPYGYLDIRLDLLAKILKNRKCELLITYVVGFLDRFSYDIKHCGGICEILGINQETLDELKTHPKEERERKWLSLLKNKLSELTGKEIYNLSFAMRGDKNTTLYYLTFFTKSIDGIKQMKESMWKISKQYIYSDYNFNQKLLLDYQQDWVRQAADCIYEKYRGTSVKQHELINWATLNTPFIWRQSILKQLEKENRFEYVGNRKRAFTYSDENATLNFKG